MGVVIMPRNEDPALTRRQKEKLTVEILEEIDNTVKKDLVDEVVNDVRGEFNTTYKNEIKEQIKDELVKDIKEDIKKEEKKLSRSKSWKIFRLYIYLIALIACSVFMIIKLYNTGNLDITKNEYIDKLSSVVSKNETTTTTTEVVKDLNYYKDNYGYLMNNVKVSNIDLLKGTYEVSSISMADRLAIVFNSLDSSDILVDGQFRKVSEDTLVNQYKKVFGSNDDYQQTSFKVSNNTYVYTSSLESYIAIVSEDINEYVENEVINVEEADNTLIFTCSVAYVKGNHVYNINSPYYRIAELDEGKVNFGNLINRLTKVSYTFEKNEDSYKLIKIEKNNK